MTYDLSLTRRIDAPREVVFRAWSGSDHLRRWWGPHGVVTTHCELDFKAGGRFRTVMHDLDGREYINEGVFLEVAENARIVFTDALTSGWRPSARAFMVAVISLDDDGRSTRCTATARHWDDADRHLHEDMGFHRIWGENLDRLSAYVLTLNPTETHP